MATDSSLKTTANAAGSSGGNSSNNARSPSGPSSTAATATAQSSSAGTNHSNGNSTSGLRFTPTDQAVLDYLKSKGMGSAVLELQAKLKGSTSTTTTTASSATAFKEQLEAEDDQARNQRLALTKATGGGFGYDLDAAAPIIQWGVPDNNPAATSGGNGTTGTNVTGPAILGVHEAKSYLDAFCALQLWVLSLPDDTSGAQPIPNQNAITKAQEIIQQQQKGDNTSSHISLSTLMHEISKPIINESESSTDMNNEDRALSTPTGTSTLSGSGSYALPPSAKPELLAVTFALLVHTYCELLEVGMESTAHVLRDAFAPIYQPLYGEAFKDFYQCTTTEDIVKLNTHNSQHMESLQQLKGILLQIANLQYRREELSQTQIQPEQQAARKAKLQEYAQTIGILQQKHTEQSKKASAAFERMYDLPFLRRARAVRWQLTLSTLSYALLAQFLNSTALQHSLLSMSTLLQTKCELHVEKRDPMPITPPVLLDDNRDKRHPDLNKTAKVNWAAPSATDPEIKTQQRDKNGERPFPPFHLQEEYENESDARRDKRAVQFNRALLMNGFRRLEALERKREFDVMERDKNTEDKTSKVTTIRRANPLEPSILLSTLCASVPSEKGKSRKSITDSNGMTQTSRSSSTNSKSTPISMSASLWEEAGIGLTCAELSPPDGRLVAVGCDDAAVRVWDMDRDSSQPTMTKEVCQVLLGHKNGFPVFDVSWNRDGRSLLSCGGDGSIRLWDTKAQGPFGEVTNDVNRSVTAAPKKANVLTNAIAKDALNKATVGLEEARKNPDMTVPGLKAHSSTYESGAALAVYRGHVPNTPIWSVAFAPSGYYFASAGGDATARLWVTDRPAPVRLFAGHTSDSIHSVAFHPNTNYILTGADDKTVRLWDIQTGKCVRLLNGCSSGIYKVQIDPSGQYAVGADAMGIVHMWDLGSGKKVKEFRPLATGSESVNKKTQKSNWGMLHALSFSSCGKALATGGDDRCVRIWDIQSAFRTTSPIVEVPAKTLPTKRTLLLDLQFTKRNLLLSVGKYISAVPLVNTVTD